MMAQVCIDRRQLLGGMAAGLALSSHAAALAATDVWEKLNTEAYAGKQDDIFFVSPDIGWYGNGRGRLYRTVDGGTTWKNIWSREGTFIRALGFIDERRGFLGNVGTDYYPGVTDHCPLYRSEDGGASWEPVRADGIETVAGICGIDILPVTRIFQGELRTAHLVHAAGRVGGPAKVLRSEDDGQTWQVIDLSHLAAMILDVKFHTPMVGFLAASAPSETGEGEARILRTLDGGRSWTSVYRSGRRLENVWKMSWPSKRIGYGTIQSYDDATNNVHRVIVKTTDGGQNWHELPLDTGIGIQEFGVGFVDEQHGWVGAKAHGYETLDGGHSWRPASIGSAVNKIRVVRQGARGRAFAIGKDVYRADL